MLHCKCIHIFACIKVYRKERDYLLSRIYTYILKNKLIIIILSNFSDLTSVNLDRLKSFWFQVDKNKYDLQYQSISIDILESSLAVSSWYLGLTVIVERLAVWIALGIRVMEGLDSSRILWKWCLLSLIFCRIGL